MQNGRILSKDYAPKQFTHWQFEWYGMIPIFAQIRADRSFEYCKHDVNVTFKIFMKTEVSGSGRVEGKLKKMLKNRRIPLWDWKSLLCCYKCIFIGCPIKIRA